MEHSHRTNRWGWLVAEFAIIVAGVLSALFVDAHLEQQRDAELAVGYRSALVDDISYDMRALGRRIVYYQDIMDNGDHVLADLDGSAPLSDLEFAQAAFLAAEEWDWTPISATFRDLESTGNMRLIGDLGLRGELVNYHRSADARRSTFVLPREYRQLARGLLPLDFQAAMHERCYQFVGDTLDSELAMDTGCDITPDEFPLRDAVIALRSDPALVPLLRYRLSQTRIAQQLFRGQREIAVQVYEALHEAD